MRQFCLVLSFLFIASQLPAQDFSKTDEQARKIEAPENNDVASLAKALSVGCQNEQEKARSFFVWVAENIHYDVQLFEDKDDVSREKRKAMQTPEKVIKRKKGVCEGYTNLYNALCSSIGIRALAVPGVTKNQKGNVSQFGHNWSLICADGKWGLVDATWGAGIVNMNDGKYHKKLNDLFFFARPETLLEDHYPNDPLFQCMANPLSLNEFELSGLKLKAALSNKNSDGPTPGFGNISDSLSAIFPFDSAQYLFNSGHRALQVNPNNNYGSWSVGSFYYQHASMCRNQFFQSIKDLAPLDHYPKLEWFEEQLPVLKNWEAYSKKCLEALKNASGQDSYSRFVLHLRQNAQNSLAGSAQAIEQNQRLKAAVKNGVRVKMTSE